MSKTKRALPEDIDVTDDALTILDWKTFVENYNPYELPIEEHDCHQDPDDGCAACSEAEL